MNEILEQAPFKWTELKFQHDRHTSLSKSTRLYLDQGPTKDPQKIFLIEYE